MSKRAQGYLLFAICVFAGAFLLFQVEPIIGKFLLPRFGGVSTVWTTCLVFYQVLLLAGYLYAHLLSYLPIRKQAFAHVIFLCAGLLVFLLLSSQGMPSILPHADSEPQTGTSPQLEVIKLLFLSVGIPFFFLSSTSTLMQTWFAGLNDNRSPYTLYSLSNVGSLLALLSFPIIVEPLLPLKIQASLWMTGYAAYALVLCSCAFVAARIGGGTKQIELNKDATVESGSATTVRFLRNGVYCFFLSACSSSLLISTTNQLTQNIAPVPLLWIMPLSLYLISFIICFRQGAPDSRDGYIPVVTLAAAGSWYALEHALSLNILAQIALHCFTLFACCMLCHKEIYRIRPPARQLTAFYLMIAAGGAVGALLVGIGAPLLLNDFYEFQISIIACGAVAVGILLTIRQPWMKSWWFPLSATMFILIALLWSNMDKAQSRTVLKQRSFYGCISVREHDIGNGMKDYSLWHGQISHGLQYADGPLRTTPTLYYSEDSGMGLALRYHPNRLNNQPLRIGAVGLGIGTLAAYGKTNDSIRFYEINPDVIAVATGKYFTYLADSKASISIVLGDARLSLENELKQGMAPQFDVLVVDAFNGDSIPTHLLTLEAFQVYLRCLAPGGIIAFHVSNIYLDLVKVLRSAKDKLHLQGRVVQNYTEPANQRDCDVGTASKEQQRVYESFPVATAKIDDTKDAKIAPWSDDFSNVFGIIKKNALMFYSPGFGPNDIKGPMPALTNLCFDL